MLWLPYRVWIGASSHRVTQSKDVGDHDIVRWEYCQVKRQVCTYCSVRYQFDSRGAMHAIAQDGVCVMFDKW